MPHNEGHAGRAMLIFTQYRPSYAVDCPSLTSSQWDSLALKTVTSLCRCGASKYKPFCDGGHPESRFRDIGTGEHR